MKFLAAILLVWLAIALTPEHAATSDDSGKIEEKVWLSQDCTNSRWYLHDSDDATATLDCWPQPDDGGN